MSRYQALPFHHERATIPGEEEFEEEDISGIPPPEFEETEVLFAAPHDEDVEAHEGREDEEANEQPHHVAPAAELAAFEHGGVHPSSTGSSSRSRSPFSPAVNDGVFSNLFAKPTTDTTDNIPRVVKEFEQLEPPTYTETIADQPAPAYGETTVVMAATSISEDGEFLIEGMPVGDGFTFFVNFLIAAAFDFVGFLVTAMLATSHAARAGARVGLGLTLFRYAAMISGRLADEEASKGYDPYDPSNPDQDDVPQGIWLPTFLSVLGTIIAMRGLADYIYAKRMETVFRASSEPVPV